MQKKLMLLGGSRYLMPVIKAAHDLDCYVITCDYLPDNYAHKFSDEYANVSIIDKDAVLAKAQELKIDGIMSFACDPGVVTAAYVAEKIGLPTCGPYESVCILQNKGKFRTFLAEHSFNVPTAKGYCDIQEALADIHLFHWPIIVKPTDCAGSKGVTRVDTPVELEQAIRHALSFSHCSEFIIEDFITQKGFSSDCDSFAVNGKLEFLSFSAQHFDAKAENPYTPSAFSWGASISPANQKILATELQRLLTLLKMRTSLYNIETRESLNGVPFIMEVSPRGGGNRLSECLEVATGVRLVENSVRAAIGLPLLDFVRTGSEEGFGEIVLHSTHSGIFRGLEISPTVQPKIVQQQLWIAPGTHVGGFSGANEAIGTLMLRCTNRAQMDELIACSNEWLQVKVTE